MKTSNSASSSAGIGDRRESFRARVVRGVRRLGSWSVWALGTGVVAALLGGAFYAVFYDQLPPESAPTTAYECLNPPCFFGGPPPGVRNLPVVVSFAFYLLALALATPGLLLGMWRLLLGERAVRVMPILTFFGTLFVVAYQEIGAHLVSPCGVAPGMCEHSGQYGVDLSDRWHQLWHASFGAVPAFAVYWLIWRRLRGNRRRTEPG